MIKLIMSCSILLCCVLAGCGGDDSDSICKEAFNKGKTCVMNWDCDAKSGMEQMACETAQAVFKMDYEEAKAAGSVKCENAEKIIECEYDPETCDCKA